MTEPLPPLITITTDIARQSTLTQVLAAVQDLSRKVDILMTEDATVAATAARIEANVSATATAVNSMQALIESLKTEVAAGHLSPATMTALSQADSDLSALRSGAEADAAADSPPPAGP